MRIVVATHMGQCKGLRRILHRTRSAIRRADGHPVYIFRELVHNRQAHEELLALGAAGVLEDEAGIPANAVLVVGPHSVPRAALAKLRATARVINTSCPTVLRVLTAARAVAHAGRVVVLVGQVEHEETEMVRSEIPDVVVVSCEADLAFLPRGRALGFVSQSTYSVDRYNWLAMVAKARGYDVVQEMTCCTEITERLGAARELARLVDKVVVVGGRNSHNTTLLREACQHIRPTWQIEIAEELQEEWFAATDVVGVTAGASTPDGAIDRVLERLRRIAVTKSPSRAWYRVLHGTSNAGVYLSRAKVKILDLGLRVLEWGSRVWAMLRAVRWSRVPNRSEAEAE